MPQSQRIANTYSRSGIVHAKKSKRRTASPKKRTNIRIRKAKATFKLLKQLKLGASVRCLAIVDNQFLWEASKDGSIHIRDLKSGEELARMKDHSSSERLGGEKLFVNAMVQQFEKVWVADSWGHLRAYSTDGTTIYYSGGSGCQAGIKTLQASEDFDTDLIFSGGEDWSVLISRSSDASNLKILSGHKEWINSLTVDNYQMRLWSGAGDGLRVWTRELLKPARNIKENESEPSKSEPSKSEPSKSEPSKSEPSKSEPSEEYYIQLLEKPMCVVSLLAVEGNMWVGTKDSYISVWRTSDYKMIHKFKAQKPSADTLIQVGHVVISSSALSRQVKVWSIEKLGLLIYTIQVPLRTKIVDMVSYGRIVWMGGRQPGGLLKYSIPPKRGKSRRKDGLSLEHSEVDARTFRNWVNYVFSNSKHVERTKYKIPFGKLVEFMSDGVLLCYLLDELSNENSTIKIPFEIPKTDKDKVMNICAALDYMQNQGMDIEEIDVEDIENLEGCTNILWEIIRKYHIRLGYLEKRTRVELLKWANSKIKLGIESDNRYVQSLKKYKTKIKEQENEKNIIHKQCITSAYNWDWSWYDGFILSAFVDYFSPGVPFENLDYDRPEVNIDIAKQWAEKINIPSILETEDLVYSPSPRSVMTYCACFRPAQSTRTVDSFMSFIRPDFYQQKKIRGLDDDDELLPEEWAIASTGKKKVTFTAFAKDGDGYPVANAMCEVKLKGIGTPVKVMVKRNENSEFSCSYQSPLISGKYTLDCKMNGQSVRHCPFQFVVRAAVDYSKSYAKGPGLLPNRRSGAFTIFGVNQEGSKLVEAKCHVQMTGPQGPIMVKVENNEDSTWSAMYHRPLGPGQYTINIFLNEKTIKTSPVVFIEPCRLDPNKSYAKGPGLKAPCDNNPSLFTVYAVDLQGKPLLGADCAVDILGPDGSVGVDIEDNGDGTFTVKYEPPTVAGDYVISSMLDQQPVHKEFFTVKETIDLVRSYAEGAGLSSKGDSGEFIVFANDKNNKPFLDSRCDVNVVGPSGAVPVKVTNNFDGTFSIHYERPLLAGECQVEILLNEQPLKSSPIIFTLPKRLDPSKSYTSGVALSMRGKKTGIRTFTVFAIDRSGEPFLGAKCEAKIIGPNGPLPITINNNNDGSFNAVYTRPTQHGEYNVSIKLNNYSIKEVPAKFVLQPLDLAKSYTNPSIALSIREKKACVRKFTVFSINKSGKPFLGAHCEVKIIAPDGPVSTSVKNNDDGTFNVEYIPSRKSGLYNISVKLNGHHIKKSPVTFILQPLDINKSYAEGIGLHDAICTQKRKHGFFIVYAVNKMGYPFLGAKCKVLVSNKEGIVPVNIIDNDDGSFRVEYKEMLKADAYRVKIQLNNQPLKEYTFIIKKKQKKSSKKHLNAGKKNLIAQKK